MRFLVLLAVLPCILASNVLELVPQLSPPVHPLGARPDNVFRFPHETKTCCEDSPWIPHKLTKLDNVLYETARINSITFKRLSVIIEEIEQFERTQVEVDQHIIGTKTEIYQNGVKGVKGYAGVRGEHGPPGDVGEPGIPGRSGSVGERGRPGNTGRPGRKGAKGPAGFKGPQGRIGLPGKLDEHCKVVNIQEDSGSREHDRDRHSGEHDRDDGKNFGPGNDEKKFGDNDDNKNFYRSKRSADEVRESGEELGYDDELYEHGKHHQFGDWGWGKCALPGERGPRGPPGPAGPVGHPGHHGHQGPKGFRGRAGQKGGRGADCCIFNPVDHPWSEPEW